RNRIVPLPRKIANFVEMIPSELFALQPLDSLRLCFFDFAHSCSDLVETPAQKQKTHVALTSGTWASELLIYAGTTSAAASSQRCSSCDTYSSSRTDNKSSGKKCSFYP